MRYLAIVTLLGMSIIAMACSGQWSDHDSPLAVDGLSLLATIASTATTPWTPARPQAGPTPDDKAQPSMTIPPAPAERNSQLKMVLIRVSAREVQELRKMPIDIVRIRQAAIEQLPSSKDELLQRSLIVEAVVPAGLLAKLRDLGFDVTEVP